MWFSTLLIGTVRLLVGASPRWIGSAPTNTQRIYFANHQSHFDGPMILQALPPPYRHDSALVCPAA